MFGSRDRGRLWDAPMVLTAPPGTMYFHPQLAVDRHGHVGLSVFALTGGRVQVAMSISTSPATSFPPVRSITPGPGFDPALGLALGSGAATEHWIGDYQGLATTPGAFHPVWNDTRTGRLELFSTTVPVGH